MGFSREDFVLLEEKICSSCLSHGLHCVREWPDKLADTLSSEDHFV